MANSRVLGTGNNVVTTPYGNGHTGIDLINDVPGLPDILAHTAGTVIFCQTGFGNNPGSSGNASYGNCVKLQHANGMCTLYAHLGSVAVNNGQTVSTGQKIGVMGNTGNSYGAHLHFEVFENSSSRINPAPYINADLPGAATSGPAKPTPTAPGGAEVAATVWLKNAADGKVTDMALKADHGSLWYQVHVLGGEWLPKVEGFDVKDHENGYAGNGKAIDAIRVYYDTPAGEPYRQARYAVKTGEAGWLPEQVDDSTENGMDGYAGNLGQAVTAVKLRIAAQ